MHHLLLLLLSLLQLCRGQNQTVQDEFPGLQKIFLPATAHMRVVGGETTTIERLGGYLIALRYYGTFICGGSLIHERVVVSAAHCFLGRDTKQEWIVEGGITLLSENGPTVPVQDFVVPSTFREESMHMDVAVVLLLKPLRGEKIAPIGLCTQHLVAGLNLTVSGWGLSDPRATSPQLQIRTVTVPVIKKTICRQTYKNSLALTNAMFCAGVLGHKDACTFDSGGPIVYETPYGNKELCGIVSFGISCASPKYPGVYTDVNYVKPFITAIMSRFMDL